MKAFIIASIVALLPVIASAEVCNNAHADRLMVEQSDYVFSFDGVNRWGYYVMDDENSSTSMFITTETEAQLEALRSVFPAVFHGCPVALSWKPSCSESFCDIEESNVQVLTR